MEQEMSSQSQQDHVSKRINRACQRCRRQKTKCSGQQPCEYCERRNLSCSFQSSEQKIVVTRAYLDDLKSKIQSLEHERHSRKARQIVAPGTKGNEEESLHDHDGFGVQSGDTPRDARTGQIQTDMDCANPGGSLGISASTTELQTRDFSTQQRSVIAPEPTTQPDNVDTGLTNPMVTGSWSYATDGTGRTWFLGTSSNWSFACRAISIAHETLLDTPFAADTLLFDGAAYLSDWENLKAADSSRELSLPSRDHALHLIRSVNFHLGQLFHLFDEETFMLSFHHYHDGGFDPITLAGFWYVHYLLILAFGKAFVVHKTKPAPPPGAELFVRAQRLLPDMTTLCQIPINATEILCCMAIYLQALDFRNSAYNFIGQAKRIALFEGFHTDMQGRNLNEEDAERCRRIWWTIYVLDHQMTSLIGVPIMLRESDIHARRPIYESSSKQAEVLEAHISLSRTMAEVVDTVYGPEGRLDSKFMSSMKAALTNVAKLMPKLEQVLKSPSEVSSGGLSRASAHLQLLNHQCIVLTTRPLLLSCLSKMLPELRSSGTSRSAPTDSILSMLRICAHSAQQMTSVLDGLQRQNLIDTFLSFDLEATFSSAVIIIMVRALFPELLEDKEMGLRIANSVLDEMSARGNIVAQSRKHALKHFEEVLACLTSPAADSDLTGVHGSLEERNISSLSHAENIAVSTLPIAYASDLGYGFGYSNVRPDSLSAAHIQWAIDSFSTRDLDWFTDSATTAEDGCDLPTAVTYNV